MKKLPKMASFIISPGRTFSDMFSLTRCDWNNTSVRHRSAMQSFTRPALPRDWNDASGHHRHRIVTPPAYVFLTKIVRGVAIESV